MESKIFFRIGQICMIGVLVLCAPLTAKEIHVDFLNICCYNAVMSLLGALLFLFIFIFYRLFFPAPNGKSGAFVLGLISGLLVLPLCIVLKITAYNSADFHVVLGAFFFSYFFLPSFFGLILYSLFTFFSFSAENIPSALFGIFSVFVFYAVFEFANIPEASPVLILIALYTLLIFFVDIVLLLFLNILIMRHALIISAVSYLVFLFAAFFACAFFPLWFFKYPVWIYLTVPFIAAVFMGFLLFIVKKKS